MSKKILKLIFDMKRRSNTNYKVHRRMLKGKRYEF